MSKPLKRTMNDPHFRVERKEGELPKITGYASVFDTVVDMYWFTESIARGAFKESLERGDDVRALFNHDPSLILGRTPKTLSLKEDETGLLMEIQPPDTQLGRDLTVSIERGDVSQASFGFYIEEEKISRDGDKTHFTITKARLFDVSPVTFPAYPTTEVEVQRAKSEQEQELAARLKRHMPMVDVNRLLFELRQRKIDLLNF